MSQSFLNSAVIYNVVSWCALLFSGRCFHPRYRPAHRRSVDPDLPCNLCGVTSRFSNTPCRDDCPSLANPCPSTPRTKLFGGYPMLQALFMNDVSNLLLGVLRPQLPKVPFLRFFQYGIDEITHPQDSLVGLCVSSRRSHHFRPSPKAPNQASSGELGVAPHKEPVFYEPFVSASPAPLCDARFPSCLIGLFEA